MSFSKSVFKRKSILCILARLFTNVMVFDAHIIPSFKWIKKAMQHLQNQRFNCQGQALYSGATELSLSMWENYIRVNKFISGLASQWRCNKKPTCFWLILTRFPIPIIIDFNTKFVFKHLMTKHKTHAMMWKWWNMSLIWLWLFDL